MKNKVNRNTPRIALNWAGPVKITHRIRTYKAPCIRINGKSAPIYGGIRHAAIIAARGTLKHLHSGNNVDVYGHGSTGSADPTIQSLRNGLAADLAGRSVDSSKTKDCTISDGMDCLHTAYLYLLEQVTANGYTNMDDTITRHLKTRDKTRSIMQWAGAEVSSYIRNHSAAVYSAKTTYIEDLADPDSDYSAAELITIPQSMDIGQGYDGSGAGEVYAQLMDMVNSVCSRESHRRIIIYRLRGLTPADISERMGITQSAVIQQLNTLRDRMLQIYPDATRRADYYRGAKRAPKIHRTPSDPVAARKAAQEQDHQRRAADRAAIAVDIPAGVQHCASPLAHAITRWDHWRAMQEWHRRADIRRKALSDNAITAAPAMTRWDHWRAMQIYHVRADTRREILAQQRWESIHKRKVTQSTPRHMVQGIDYNIVYDPRDGYKVVLISK